MIVYDPLFVTLAERGIRNITDLKKLAGLHSSTIAKFNKNEKVSFEVLDRLCEALDCKVEDIIAYKATEESI